MDLRELRLEIDKVDREIVSLFCRRMHISAEIAEWKAEHRVPILDAAREEEKLQSVMQLADPELAEETRQLYATLFALSRSYQDRHSNTAKHEDQRQF